jgi:putative FmdB family regulatory protein
VPIYEYACMECESHFEELVRSSEQAVVCPECGAANVLKQFSTFAVGVGARASASESGPSSAPRAGGCCGGSCGCAH